MFFTVPNKFWFVALSKILASADRYRYFIDTADMTIEIGLVHVSNYTPCERHLFRLREYFNHGDTLHTYPTFGVGVAAFSESECGYCPKYN